jgi:GTPase
MARFKINNIFTVTDRGQILEGEITEGEIAPGDLIRLLINDNALSIKIKSVEYIDHIGQKTKIGLIVGPFDKNVQEKLRVIIGRTVSII